jgi:hypothetical protein
MKIITRVLFFICSVTILFLWFLCNYKCRSYVANFQSYSEGLLTRAIALNITGQYHYGGFMAGNWGGAYTHQFGLQYQALNYFAPKNLSALEAYLGTMRLINAFIFVMLLTCFVLIMKREFGKCVALFLTGCLMGSKWLIAFAFNLYWVIFLAFAPFVLTWAFYPKSSDGRKFYGLWLLTGALVFFKALCGYEYITNVILSPLVPIVYYEVLKMAPVKRIVQKSIRIILSGLIGFFLAICFHVRQAWDYSHSLKKALLDDFLFNALIRTSGDDRLKKLFHWSPWSDLRVFKDYFSTDALSVLGVTLVTTALLYLILPGIIILSRRLVFMNELQKRKFQALIASTCVACGASLSWAVLALGHMRDHLHMNSIIFFLPFFLMIFVLMPFFLKMSLCKNGG